MSAQVCLGDQSYRANTKIGSKQWHKLYKTATKNIYVSIRELLLLSLVLPFTIKSAQRDSVEQERRRKKKPVILGTKAGIIQGIIQEELTFFNRTIPSISAKYSNILVIIPDTTNQFSFSLLGSFMSPSHGEKWLM